MDKRIKLIRDRFIHRTDRFALQWLNDRGQGYWPVRDGECTHTPKHKARDCPDMNLVPLKPSDITQHLKGKKTLGIYQLSEEHTVKWICFDVDINKPKPGETFTNEDVRADAQQHTLRLAKRLVALNGRGSFLVEDTGNRGYHIWIFFDKPVSARSAQMFAMWLHLSEEPADNMHVEVFPKQSSLNVAGNLVKLPLGIHKKTNNRCWFVDAQFKKIDDQWAALASVRLWSQEMLNDIIEKEQIQPPLSETQGSGIAGKSDDAFICMQRAMTEGLHEGTRDAGVYRLALYLKSRTFPSDIAEAAIQAVNEKSSPPLPNDTVTAKVESAYESNYSPFPCSDRLIDSYCSSKCKFFGGKVQEHWTRYGREREDAIGKISRD